MASSTFDETSQVLKSGMLYHFKLYKGTFVENGSSLQWVPKTFLQGPAVTQMSPLTGTKE